MRNRGAARSRRCEDGGGFACSGRRMPGSEASVSRRTLLVFSAGGACLEAGQRRLHELGSLCATRVAVQLPRRRRLRSRHALGRNAHRDRAAPLDRPARHRSGVLGALTNPGFRRNALGMGSGRRTISHRSDRTQAKTLSHACIRPPGDSALRAYAWLGTRLRVSPRQLAVLGQWGRLAVARCSVR